MGVQEQMQYAQAQEAEINIGGEDGFSFKGDEYEFTVLVVVVLLAFAIFAKYKWGK